MNNQLLFRASRFGDLCGSVYKSELTPKQEKELDVLMDRVWCSIDQSGKRTPVSNELPEVLRLEGKKPLTPNQCEEMHRLIAKRDAPPELDLTAKTWVRELFNENVRQTWKPNFSTMQTEHGNEAEKSAINRIAKVMGVGMCLKSSVTLKDALGDGHPDVYKKGLIGFDVKCSFTDNTFPLWDDVLKNKTYEWQAKRYAMMAQMDSWWICYSLENASDEIVMKDAQKLWWEAGYTGRITNQNGDFVSLTAKQFYEQVKEMHTFDHLPDWARVKTYEVFHTVADMDLATKRVEMGRAYYAELEEKYKIMQKEKV